MAGECYFYNNKNEVILPDRSMYANIDVFRREIFNLCKVIRKLNPGISDDMLNEKLVEVINEVDLEADHNHRNNIDFKFVINEENLAIKLTDSSNNWKTMTGEEIYFVVHIGLQNQVDTNASTSLVDVPDSVRIRLARAFADLVEKMPTLATKISRKQFDMRYQLRDLEFSTLNEIQQHII